MLLRREPEPEDYEVDHSLPDCELRCQFISPFYPLVETRLEFVGGAFSNTCSPIQEEELPDEDKVGDKDSTKSSSHLPSPLLSPKRKKLQKITPQRKTISEPGSYIESGESDTDSYDSLLAQKATTHPPSPHFVSPPLSCGPKKKKGGFSKTEVNVVVAYDDDDVQNSGCGFCHLLRKMAKRIKKLFK
uniref:uncharacterized protein LOC113475010 n=1 Tax=Ciona intestinalis TaxID=7719 RepID=UPI000EF4622D|nr:uncharacterized protein LOC113475010 [Ciona intestinalis]|eukprot:XP_026694182.1 uncharacterized protein LOC113475010 [Ciona intestinalis]